MISIKSVRCIQNQPSIARDTKAIDHRRAWFIKERSEKGAFIVGQFWFAVQTHSVSKTTSQTCAQLFRLCHKSGKNHSQTDKSLVLTRISRLSSFWGLLKAFRNNRIQIIDSIKRKPGFQNLQSSRLFQSLADLAANLDREKFLHENDLFKMLELAY